jgi:hypothetical protein
MTATNFTEASSKTLCADCGIPLDARHFDDSSFQQVDPGPGPDLVLASFELQLQYCGVLEFFSQFCDTFAKDNSQVQTPGLRWLILLNDRPLYPYLDVEWILNPWGYGSFPFRVRLDEGASIRFVVRRVNGGTSSSQTVGGRIAGRYWYNSAYGDVWRPHG